MMKVLIVVSAILLLIVIILSVYIITIKREMRNIKNELLKTRKRGYDRQITVTLFDRDFSLMTSEINKNLDFQKQLKLESERSKRSMKQAISNIAHDLRTPLTVIKGNLQMVSREKNISTQSREYVRLATEKTDTLRTMIDDFFELSVLESDNVPIEPEEIDITEALMQFIIAHESVIRDHGLTPQIEFPEKSIYILADEQYLQRMFSNLINNIVKYARESFMVRLRAEEQTDCPDMCEVTFANALEDQMKPDVEHLFERTYRGDRARHGQGAGLGLYIVKLLAEKQGAEVSAQKEENMLYITIRFKMITIL